MTQALAFDLEDEEGWECLADLSGLRRDRRGAPLYLGRSPLCTQGKFVVEVGFLAIDEDTIIL